MDPNPRLAVSWLPTTPGAIALYVITESPSDVRGWWVVRRHEVRVNGVIHPHEAVRTSTLERARASIPAGCVNLGRAVNDDPVIYETWT